MSRQYGSAAFHLRYATAQPKPRDRRRITDATEAAIRDAVRAGASQRQVALRFGIARVTVAAVMAREGRYGGGSAVLGDAVASGDGGQERRA